LSSDKVPFNKKFTEFSLALIIGKTFRHFNSLAPRKSHRASGRVTTANGRGIATARVTLTDGDGITRSTSTNGFGYFRFNDIVAGQTCIVTVQAKRYYFAEPTRVLSVTEDITDVNFIASTL